MISDDLRQSYLQRAHGLEGSIRRLVSEILQHLSAMDARHRRRVLGNKIDVLFYEVESAIMADQEGGTTPRDQELDEVEQLSDEMIAIRAQMDRMKRRIMAQREDLELEGKRKRLDRLDRELDAGLDG